MFMENLLELLRMFFISGFTNNFNINAKNIGHNPSSFMYDIFYGDTNTGQKSTQLSNSSWSVGYLHGKLDKTSICCKTSLQTSAQYSCVNIATTKWQNYPEKKYHWGSKKFFKVLVLWYFQTDFTSVIDSLRKLNSWSY